MDTADPAINTGSADERRPDECWTIATTTDSAELAAGLARGAVEARLAACAQVIGPLTSTYWWRGEIDTAQEWQVIFKTTAARYAQLEQHLRTNHSYETPEIVGTPIVAGASAYLDWVREQTRQPPND